MRLLGTLLTIYRSQSIGLVLALLFATALEGISLTALLPTLNLVLGEADGERTPLGRWAESALTGLGLTPTLGLLLTIIVLGLTAKNGLLLYANRKVGYIATQITTDLRLELLRGVMESKWAYFIKQSVGQMANAMAAETMRVTEAFIFGTRLLATVVQAFVYTFVAVSVSWQATLFCLVASSFIVFVSQGLVRMSKKAGQKQTHVYHSLLGRLTDTLQSVKPFKAMERGEASNRILQNETELLNKALRKQVLGRAALDSAQEPLFAIFICLGIYLALARFEMAVSTVTVMALVAGKLATIIGDIQKLYQKMVVRESAYWSVRSRIDEAVAESEELPTGNVVEFSRDLELRDIRFAYGENKVLQGLSLHVPYGSMTTLIGPSGSGKTTIIDLLVGLVRPDSGEVLIDGRPLESVDLRGWRRQVGYVPQENLLLHDTIAKNVSLGEDDVTDADIEYALRAAGAWEFVCGLEDGVHTVAGERGARFSGGQRQRIMLARALVHRPRLLILDEATNALDPEIEAAICRTLEELKGQVTILAVTHQSALAAVSDRVYRVVDGRFVEEPASTPRLAES
ncbi:MAG: ABC transporter ATP-binding protein [Chromatiales bacterium]|nr:MAG: ABC transporter ATP-binding protein [Chromatiales bacterium]